MSNVEEQVAHAPRAEGDDIETVNQNELGGERDGTPAAGGNVDKIREIIFGGQMRDYERKFSRLEERLSKEASDLREDGRRRLDALENFFKQELEALGERLRAEQRVREESAQSQSQALRDTGQTLERKLAQFEEQTARGQRELRQQVLDQSKTLGEEIRQKHDDLRALLEREVAALGNDKTDRAALASLFTEVALRLSNEFSLPGDN